MYATIEHLKEAEKKLPYLLSNPNIWQTLDVNYFPPRVERLWTQYDENHRLFIHIIHPTEELCLFHKHRWPASFKIVKGSYEMGVSYNKDEITSEEAYKVDIISKFILEKGSYYEMTNTHTLHYVKPLKEYSISLMITGPLYKESVFRKEVLDVKLNELSFKRKNEILENISKYYPV